MFGKDEICVHYKYGILIKMLSSFLTLADAFIIWSILKIVSQFMTFKGLKPTRIWKIHPISLGLWIPKVLFFVGRIIFKILFLKIDIDRASRNSGPMSFQETTVFG